MVARQRRLREKRLLLNDVSWCGTDEACLFNAREWSTDHVSLKCQQLWRHKLLKLSNKEIIKHIEFMHFFWKILHIKTNKTRKYKRECIYFAALFLFFVCFIRATVLPCFRNAISIKKPKHTTLSLEKKKHELPLALYNVQVHTHISVLPPSLFYHGFLFCSFHGWSKWILCITSCVSRISL